MAIVDASAVIGFFADELAKDEVQEILLSNAQISAVNLAEVYDHFTRVRLQTRSNVDDRIVTVRRFGSLVLVPADEQLAARAGELRAKHYHHIRRDVSLADCFALATAESVGDSLATTDRHLAAMARDEGVDVIALPDESGVRP